MPIATFSDAAVATNEQPTSMASNDESILSATITSIRSNVSRVLDMYFHNVSDEYGYGAGTTQSPNYDTSLAAAAAAAAAAATTTTTILPQTLKIPITTNYNSNRNETIPMTTTTEKLINVLGTAAIRQQNATNSTNFVLTTASSITYPNYHVAIKNQENCSALFTNYSQTEHGILCNSTWDGFLCWPPTPAGVMARMHCPSGWHGIDTANFANRKCELNGVWGSRPNEAYNPNGWTDYNPCFKPEVKELLEQMKNLDPYIDIAKRTRTLEIVGLILSLFALILSLIIFCNFRTLRNNRTKIHKNLFFAMVLQVIVRLTLYLDQAFRRGKMETAINDSSPGIENTPYLCEASYILLEYARTAMFMWMFIEGLYLHNMVTVAVFQGRFPHTVFSLLGWGMPVLMTTVWASCTVAFTNSGHDCLWYYNLTPYYWILEGPRLIVILLNFFFLMNIIRVLVVKLRQSQASDIEQTRKAVRAAIVLLPLLGITNLLHLLPDLHTPWKFALWSYVTHFLTSFQGFFIAMIYCFLNGEVRTVLLKSVSVYMSVRGHPEWAPKRASMFSGAYNTAPDTDAHLHGPVGNNNKRYRGGAGQNVDNPSTATALSATNTPLLSTFNRNDSPPMKMHAITNGSCAPTPLAMRAHIIDNNMHNNNAAAAVATFLHTNHYNKNAVINNNHQQQQHHQQITDLSSTSSSSSSRRNTWMITLCFRGQKNKCVMSSKKMPTQIFTMTNTNALA